MNIELIEKLLREYKETQKCLLMGIDWLDDSDYAKGKLDLIKVIISDFENLLMSTK